jgi:ATP-dependent RNA helicase RhlB
VKFSDLQLHPKLQANLDRIQFSECTPIQAEAIPWLRKGKDLSGLAQTGTGKTGAFLIPLLDRVLKAVQPDETVAASETTAFPEWKRKHFILVLVPTRELAEQVQKNAEQFLENTGLGSVSIYGGTTYDKQISALKQGIEVVIATPGRLLDLYKDHIVDLGLVRAVVFDEADRMFDMGFKDDMKFILRRIPRERQFLVFSATLNFEVLNTAYEYGAEPVEINISRDQAKAENVKDSMLHVGQEDKPRTLLSLVKKHNPRQAIIFSNFKHNVERIAKFLSQNGVPAMGISSLLTQGQRNRVMAQFKAENDRNILVATDVAARGLDILGVDLVINFDLPDDAENYVHRIGRTGRAGATGQAFSMVGDRDVDALQRIEEYLGHKLEVVWLEDSELVADFTPFPREDRRPKDGKRSFNGDRPRSGGPRPPRRQEGNRQEGGRPEGRFAGGRDRSENRNRHRDRDTGRHEGGRHEGGRPEGDRQANAEGRPQGQGPRRDQQGQPRREGYRQQGSRQGNRQGPRQEGRQGQRQESRQGQGGNRPRYNDSKRPQRSQQSRGGAGRSSGAPMAASSGGIGQKVSGFFKKIFGK